MTIIKKPANNSVNPLYLKAANFCAYQERSQNEVRDKLYKLGATPDEVEELICQLILENYLNEERFAKVFAGGKFRIKHWGKVKIEQELKLKGISPRNINTGLLEIEDQEYIKTLRHILEKKQKSLKEKNPYQRKHKISLHAIRKGYEPSLVWELLNELEP